MSEHTAPNSNVVQIGYISEPVVDYVEGLQKVLNLKQLREHVEFFRPIAADACERVSKMSAKDFTLFLIDLKKAKRAAGTTAQRIVDEWGDILMPEVMLKVSLAAEKYHAPFGTVYIRMKEAGAI